VARRWLGFLHGLIVAANGALAWIMKIIAVSGSPFMISFKRKAALGIAAVSLALAALAGAAAWLIARDKAEDSLVTVTVEEIRRLMRNDAFRLEGLQAPLYAQVAAQALVAGKFDIASIYTANGALLAEQMSPEGRALDKELAPRAPPAYAQAFFESRRLAGDRRLLRVFVPLYSVEQRLSGYVEGARLVPDWQLALIDSDARKVALLVALTALLCGGALYALFIRLFSASQRRTRELLESHLSMMEALGHAIARRDSDTGAHNYRVAWIAATLAQAVGLHGRRMRELIVGSFLHDVGKIGIPDSVLLKPDRLSDEEMKVMRAHVGMGEEIVAGAGWVESGRAVVAGHHEKWDGSGYPRGLAGEDIALVARIFAIADVFDALCSRRPHKQPMPFDAVMQAMNDESGKHFDPHLLKVFSASAADIYRTLVDSTEEQAKTMLEAMVHKHFSL
jgi:HD-GYP domain-containing protein (c-di-GMP phosphodiesterase class II)